MLTDVNETIIGELRRAIDARRAYQDAKREYERAPNERAKLIARLRVTARELAQHRANEALTLAWCRHLGLDPDRVDDAALLEATAKLCEAAS